MKAYTLIPVCTIHLMSSLFVSTKRLVAWPTAMHTFALRCGLWLHCYFGHPVLFFWSLPIASYHTWSVYLYPVKHIVVIVAGYVLFWRRVCIAHPCTRDSQEMMHACTGLQD